MKPKDLKKLFGTLPEWIERLPERETGAKEKTGSGSPRSDRYPFISHVGKTMYERFYVFYVLENPAGVRPLREAAYTVAFSADENFVSKHPDISSLGKSADFIYRNGGNLKEGTIVKAFFGYTGNRKHSSWYFIVDFQAPRIGICHPDAPEHLYMEGHLRSLDTEEVLRRGLRLQSTKFKPYIRPAE